MAIDLVVPVHNAREWLRKCIDSVRAYTPLLGRTIIVDDFSDAETEAECRIIAKEDKNVILIRSERQRWFTRASNLGLRMIRTPQCVLLNSDCEVGSGWLEELLACWQEASSQGLHVGLVGSTLSEPEQRRWADITYPGYVTGHCYVFSMEAITDMSVRRGTPGIYLDETRQDCIHISSDRMLCWDMNKTGWATIASMKAAVGHHGFRSWGANVPQVMSLQLKDVD